METNLQSINNFIESLTNEIDYLNNIKGIIKERGGVGARKNFYNDKKIFQELYDFITNQLEVKKRLLRTGLKEELNHPSLTPIFAQTEKRQIKLIRKLTGLKTSNYTPWEINYKILEIIIDLEEINQRILNLFGPSNVDKLYENQ